MFKFINNNYVLNLNLYIWDTTDYSITSLFLTSSKKLCKTFYKSS